MFLYFELDSKNIYRRKNGSNTVDILLKHGKLIHFQRTFMKKEIAMRLVLKRIWMLISKSVKFVVKKKSVRLTLLIVSHKVVES